MTPANQCQESELNLMRKDLSISKKRKNSHHTHLLKTISRFPYRTTCLRLKKSRLGMYVISGLVYQSRFKNLIQQYSTPTLNGFHVATYKTKQIKTVIHRITLSAKHVSIYVTSFSVMHKFSKIVYQILDLPTKDG